MLVKVELQFTAGLFGLPRVGRQVVAHDCKRVSLCGRTARSGDIVGLSGNTCEPVALEFSLVVAMLSRRDQNYFKDNCRVSVVSVRP
jgi:hypothetical protein